MTVESHGHRPDRFKSVRSGWCPSQVLGSPVSREDDTRSFLGYPLLVPHPTPPVSGSVPGGWLWLRGGSVSDGTGSESRPRGVGHGTSGSPQEFWLPTTPHRTPGRSQCIGVLTDDRGSRMGRWWTRYSWEPLPGGRWWEGVRTLPFSLRRFLSHVPGTSTLTVL